MKRAHFRPFLLWLVALFMVHVSAPHFMAIQNPVLASSQSAAPSILDQKVLVCSGKGFVYVTLAEVLTKNSPYSIHKAEHCPFCASPVMAMLPTVLDIVAPKLSITHVQAYAFEQKLQSKLLSWQRQHLRSPPTYS